MGLKNLYHRLRYVFVWGIAAIGRRGNNLVDAVAVSPEAEDFFFGYYDKCPWDHHSGRYLLGMKTTFSKRMPSRGEAAQICIIDLEKNNAVTQVGETRAWCWQQGAMLQWLGNGDRRRFAYNDHRDGQYVTVVGSIDNTVERIISYPIYCLHPDGTTALGLNYGRLHELRPGYGYVAEPYDIQQQFAPEDDGIFRIDLYRNTSDLIISLADIVKISPREDFHDAVHYINHMEFNPSGSRFVFYHRWQNRFTKKEYTRMYTASADGSNIYLLSDHDMVSHYTWKNDVELLAWANHQQWGQHYYLYTDRTNEVEPLGTDILDEDGHPSYFPKESLLLTDTYPNRLRCRKLLTYRDTTKKLVTLGKYFVPYAYRGPIRCDLHPRLDRSGKQICFDSVHEGYRRIYIADLPAGVFGS